MDQGIYTAASGAKVMEDKLLVISNNLSNAGTAGFKRQAIGLSEFEKQLDISELSQGQYRRTPIDVVVGRNYIDTKTGPYRQTDNPLDFAITGKGFFVLNDGNTTGYTRAGSFSVSPEGLLVSPQGYRVQGEGGDITLGQGNVVVDANGTITLDNETIDRFRVVDIQGSDLKRQGPGILGVKDTVVPGEMEDASIKQGSIELSNVEPMMEMIGLINAQRAYESFQKVVKSFNEVYALSINKVGSLA
ncbi:MAG: flagellar hook basal-body protein [Thermodesulfobacteriota bacterium]|nr:flagellar hook basal-body protein [Thermodesulfobacteriota bacterium]